MFEVGGSEDLPPLLMTHSRISLSMFLEWILYDKAYLPSGGSVCFCELVGGESSPAVYFRLDDGLVTVSWDLSEWSRNGLQYKVKVGTGHVEYSRYLACLNLAFDNILLACEGRARSHGITTQWFAWLEGYEPEAKSFRDHVAAVCSGTIRSPIKANRFHQEGPAGGGKAEKGPSLAGKGAITDTDTQSNP